jgi:orotate phosphoribosyltransferase-like protein
MALKKSYEPLNVDTGYGWTRLEPGPFMRRMAKAEKRFLKLKEELGFDAIAFCGSSGCAIAFSIASKHNIPLIYVRKEGEKAHGQPVEYNGDGIQVKKYLIVDDFPDSGATVFRIIDQVKKFTRKSCAYPAKPVGVLCFDTYIDTDREMDRGGASIKLFCC